jgi:hypothetical protein
VSLGVTQQLQPHNGVESPKMKTFIIILVLAIPFSLIGVDDVELLCLTSKFMGKEYVCTLHVSDLADGSLWPEGQEPPLSPQHAVKAAQAYLDKYISEPSFVPQTSRWRVEAVLSPGRS